MNIKSLLTAIMMLSSLVIVSAQTLDEELGFIYVKAEYLYQTNRYEDAVVQYNQVIAKDPSFKNAAVQRGWCKFYLAAYKGAKNDALLSIDAKGINGDNAALLGRSQVMMNDIDGAINSLTAAIALDDENTQFLEWRADAYERDDQKLRACKDYEHAMNLGSKTAESKAKSLCGLTKTSPSTTSNTGGTLPTKNNDSTINNNTTADDDNEVLSSGEREGQPKSNTEPSANTNPNGSSNSSENNGTSTGNNNSQDSVMVDDSEPAIIDETIPKEDNTVNSLKIDDDLTIDISGQELGNRSIADTPSILILADETGKVTIHICVNKAGEVTKAEFNPASMMCNVV
jgi:tetratricopeptide (TPR) repeat protein